MTIIYDCKAAGLGAYSTHTHIHTYIHTQKEENRIFVGGISAELSSEEVLTHFQMHCGQVKDIHFPKDFTTGINSEKVTQRFPPGIVNRRLLVSRSLARSLSV